MQHNYINIVCADVHRMGFLQKGEVAGVEIKIIVLQDSSPRNQCSHNAMHKTGFCPRAYIYCCNKIPLSKLLNIQNTIWSCWHYKLIESKSWEKQTKSKTTITKREPIYQEKAAGAVKLVYPKEFSELSSLWPLTTVYWMHDT